MKNRYSNYTLNFFDVQNKKFSLSFTKASIFYKVDQKISKIKWTVFFSYLLCWFF